VWAGVDKVWEQEKPEARKMLGAKRGDESHLSSARFVGRFCIVQDSLSEKADHLEQFPSRFTYFCSRWIVKSAAGFDNPAGAGRKRKWNLL